MSKGNRALLVIATLACVAALLGTAAAPARSAPNVRGAHAAPSVVAGGGLSFLNKAICKIVGAKPVADAAKELITEQSHGAVGALLADIIVSTVTGNCSYLTDKAASVVSWVYRQLAKPAQASASTYVQSFARQSEAAIASQISINGRPVTSSRVASSVSALCWRHARVSLADPVPGALLPWREARPDFGAMNGVTSLVIRECGLNATQAGYLVQATLGHLTDNTYAADRDPPIVFLGRRRRRPIRTERPRSSPTGPASTSAAASPGATFSSGSRARGTATARDRGRSRPAHRTSSPSAATTAWATAAPGR